MTRNIAEGHAAVGYVIQTGLVAISVQYLFPSAASLWLAVLVLALHRSQAPHNRSWWQTASWTVLFLVVLALVMQAIFPPQQQGWSVLCFLIVVGLLPFLLLFEATRRERRVVDDSSTDKSTLT